jgi:membrane-associated phospholipid phosphatase
MQPLFDLGLETSRWLQTTYPQLESLLAFISSLGLEEFYLLLLPLIYWCLNKQLGKHIAYVFLLSSGANFFFKHVLRGPRPYWLEPSLGLAESEEYGIPSGHTQLAATVYFMAAGWLKRGWVWILALLIVVLMGLSRVYLGVHFVHDVLAGLLLALLILAGYALWQRYFQQGFARRILGQRMLAAFTVAVAFALVYVVARLLIGEPDLTVDWADYVSSAELASTTGMATVFGSLLGAGLGLTLEGSRLRFMVNGPVWQRAVRYVFGIVITVVIWGGLKALFPEDPLWIALPLRILRYFLILFWVSYSGPALFIRLRLAEAEPDPGISLSL